MRRAFFKQIVFLLVLIFSLENSAVVYAQSLGGRHFILPEVAPQESNTSFRSDGLQDPQMDPTGAKSIPSVSGGKSGFFPGGMGALTYQVHVLGEVSSPGTYRIAASDRLYEALSSAGGVLERGSERFIEIRRRGQKSKTIDLISFKMLGDLDGNPYLLDNDIVFVPLKQKIVQIVGPVKRPGYYELKNEKNLEDVVRLAGGFTVGIADSPVKVIRFEKADKKVEDVPNDETSRQAFSVNHADVIVLPHRFTQKTKFDYNVAKLPGDNIFYPSYDNRIFVLGAVNVPGPQNFNQFSNLRQYLTLAGGTTKSAKVKKIKILTQDGKLMKAKDSTPINPGDTIVVPERYLAPESWVTMILGITSSILGITSTILVLTN